MNATEEATLFSSFMNGFNLAIIRFLQKCEGGLQCRLNAFRQLSEWMCGR